MKKIKLFLGGYINKQNAQNLNCNALAQFLDKEKYSIYTMSRDDGNINIDEIQKFATLFTFNHKIKFLKSWNYIKALYLCDILYLPRRDGLSLILFLNKFFKKKIFLTIEGIFDDFILKQIEKKKKPLHQIVNTINKVQYVYSITHFMREYNQIKIGLNSMDKVLYLGLDNKTFSKKSTINYQLKNIIFIGNDMQRKGIEEFLNLAQTHIDLNFHIVGTPHSINVDKINKSYNNVVIHGSKNPIELNEILQTMDLHLSPSKSEGFPKVILETAFVGIPSIVYGSYGSTEWINHRENGFVINHYSEINQLLNELKSNSKLLEQNSKNAIKLADDFNWKNLIHNWEEEIDRIYND